MNKTLSDAGLRALIQREGARGRMYHDSAGLATIGVGHLLSRDEQATGTLAIRGHPVAWRTGLTKRQIAALLDQDAAAAEDAVNALVTVPIDQDQFDALVSFVFNVGISTFKSSTLLRKLNRGNYTAVPQEMKRWIYSAGRVVAGLIKRREREAEQWFT